MGSILLISINFIHLTEMTEIIFVIVGVVYGNLDNRKFYDSLDMPRNVSTKSIIYYCVHPYGKQNNEVYADSLN